MSDWLVKLYELPNPAPYIETLKKNGIQIRRAMAYEKIQIVEWVRKTFGVPWAGECDVAFSNSPITCFIATSQGSIAGFACYDSTCKDFFGPIGLSENFQRQGIGKALGKEIFELYSKKGIKNIYTSVRWDSTDMLSFFKTLGFVRSSFINLRKELE